MKSLYLRIYLTVVVALALFATGSAWLFQREVAAERARIDAQASERIGAWADLIQRSLPPADAEREQQAQGLHEWSQRLRLPLALDDAQGQRIGASDSYLRRTADMPGPTHGIAVRLDDGRTLWVLRGPGLRAGGAMRPEGSLRPEGGMRPSAAPRREGSAGPLLPPGVRGVGLVVLLLLLFVAVAAGAYPVVRRLTRRLESLKSGVERFGAGELSQRVDATGRDEVAALGASFNQAAQRIEALVRSHQSLLANASHELRSPLARLKMAVSLFEDTPEGAAREKLKREIDTNIGELDALVEEVLLASRLDAQAGAPQLAPVDLIADRGRGSGPCRCRTAGRAGRADRAGRRAAAAPRAAQPARECAPLRRAGRRRGDHAAAQTAAGARDAELRVCDRGPGVPEALRERIFEPFFRLPGHAERAGGVGLGLALVKQIAAAPRRPACAARPRDGGGSCFVLSLPKSRLTRRRTDPDQEQRQAQRGRAQAGGGRDPVAARAVQRLGDGAADVEGQHIAAAEAHAPHRSWRR